MHSHTMHHALHIVPMMLPMHLPAPRRGYKPQ
jgi:hypothetical protein